MRQSNIRNTKVMVKNNQHVVTHKQGWAVKSVGALRATRVVPTQAEAIDVAKRIAQNNNSEMFIHGRDGKIRERNTYGRDPYPPKG